MPTQPATPSTASPVAAAALPLPGSRAALIARDIIKAQNQSEATTRHRDGRPSLLRLPENQIAALVHWLAFETLTYAQIKALFCERFGIMPSSTSALSKFWQRWVAPRVYPLPVSPAPRATTVIEISAGSAARVIIHGGQAKTKEATA